MLFPPSSLFEITSTLTSTSEIGAFYGKVDNIAMSQIAGDEMIAALDEKPTAQWPIQFISNC